MYLPDRELQIQSAVCTAEPKICAEGLKDISEKNNTVNNL